MPRCVARTIRGHRCRNAVRYGTRCGVHMNMDNFAEADENGMIVWDIIQRQILNRGIHEDVALRFLNHFFDTHLITLTWFRRIGLWIMNEGDRRNLMEEFEAVANQRVNTLGDISIDSQSVHRKPVSEQTNRIIRLLLNVSVPENFNVLTKFDTWKRTLVNDIKKWYNEAHCIQPDDYLYRKLINALYLHIQSSEFKDELMKRLQEETTESIGMCCMGHISRLCNVLVGFDDQFVAEAPMGQIIQERIARISELEMSAEGKALEAWKVLEELKVPEEERRAWIDAL